ncbi:hypothetical protein [Chromobacterium haemolyticum]|uniref:hypothetical protein n=1 Tax=Chromobacterium haemolyticum TaxID=394935 RepID=UPI000DEF8AB5|nr:hypothetical protein [Chromobacterium haemolyticum]
MKKLTLVYVALLVGGLSGCGGNEAGKTATAASAPPEAVAQEAPPAPKHLYALKDGFEYGYEPALSENDQKAGQAGTKLLMFKYAGARDGVYQVYRKEGSGVFVAECSSPCEFIKTMAFFGQEHIKTERMRANPNLLIMSVLADAMNGQMDQWKSEKNGKKGTIWFTEKGPKFTPDS